MHLTILSGHIGWHVADLLRAAAELDFPARIVDFRQLRASSGLPADPIDADCVVVRSMPAGSLEQVIFRMDVLGEMQSRGTPIVNSPRALEICIDKYLCGVRLESAGLLVPPTIVCQTAEDAMAAFEKLGGNVVVKPIFGSEGRGMMRIEHKDLAWRTFHTLERTQSVILLQSFVRHPGYDLRLFVLADRAIAAMKRSNRNDWRTNVAQGGETEAIVPTAEQTDAAIRAVRATGVVAGGVDLMYGPNGELYVLEVNAVPGWRALAPTTGRDIARELLLTMAAAVRS